MLCVNCGHENKGTEMHCMKCGSKLEFSPDKIQDYYEKLNQVEKAKRVQYYAARVLALTFFFFLIVFTLFLIGTGIPEDTGFVPSATESSNLIVEESSVTIQIKPIYLPYEKR